MIYYRHRPFIWPANLAHTQIKETTYNFHSKWQNENDRPLPWGVHATCVFCKFRLWIVNNNQIVCSIWLSIWVCDFRDSAGHRLALTFSNPPTLLSCCQATMSSIRKAFFPFFFTNKYVIIITLVFISVWFFGSTAKCTTTGVFAVRVTCEHTDANSLNL